MFSDLKSVTIPTSYNLQDTKKKKINWAERTQIWCDKILTQYQQRLVCKPFCGKFSLTTQQSLIILLPYMVFEWWQHLQLCFKCNNAHNTDTSTQSSFHSSAQSEAFCRKLLPSFCSWMRRQLLLWKSGMSICPQETKLSKRESRSDVYDLIGTLVALQLFSSCFF